MLKLIHSVQLLSLLLILTLFVISGCQAEPEFKAPKEYVGNWMGLGKIMLSNEFLNQRQLPFMLIIEENGSVTGYVGDASIIKTSLKKPTWWQKLTGKGKYTATFTLTGKLIENEDFARSGGTITFDGFDKKELLCHFISTGKTKGEGDPALVVEEIRLYQP